MQNSGQMFYVISWIWVVLFALGATIYAGIIGFGLGHVFVGILLGLIIGGFIACTWIALGSVLMDVVTYSASAAYRLKKWRIQKRFVKIDMIESLKQRMKAVL